MLITWQEAEIRVSGEKTIETHILKEITTYDSCSSTTPAVKMFWEVFETFSMEERTEYLKFVWGRSRLPANRHNLDRRHTIDYKSSYTDRLPEAHTCFFTLDLYNYSTIEKMRSMFITAIQLCGDIDGDRGADDIAQLSD